MPLKVKYGRRQHGFLWKLTRFLLIAAAIAIVITVGLYFYYSGKYKNEVDDRLAQGPLFASVAQVYAAPQEVRPGQHLSVASLAASLRRAGYNGNQELGSFELRTSGDTGSILIKPGAQSYLATDGATITSATDADGTPTVTAIAAESGAPLAAYRLEPQVITALSEDKNRTKRRLVTYQQIPPRMVQAVMAIEDRRFFEHGGINYLRTAKCAFQDVVSRHKNCGGSTITQQLARGFFLTPQKTLSRKAAEIMITFQLEDRFTKQQIFEMYANQIPMGQRGTFAIAGFAEAAQAYFGKDIKQLDLAECAMLAGIIQRPSYFNPYRHADRTMERRNIVLESMLETGAITATEAARAKAEPIRLAPPNVDASEAPYFVDLVHDQLVQRLGDSDTSRGAVRIYTSLDPELQRAAAEAVEAGMKNVDELVRRLHRKSTEPFSYPQVALIALNPHTGQVLALVGGRNYAASQLNHAVAERPTGSIFKPFVYATAYNNSLDGNTIDADGPFTALTRLNDDPTNFGTGGQDYTPGNFVRGEFPGMVTAVTAIAHSLNIATIALAQKVGYENVASLARSAGIVNARATPSVAIGTYNATPLDMAGAYTVFANNGVHLKPWMLASVRNANGDILADYTPEAHQVLDPRAAFLTQSLLQNVMQFGTAAKVRSLGFTAPAAGKTGTSHDAWFAGYSSDLLCVIWVGNDDYTDVKLQGADAAAPIWAAFMNRAIKLPQYSDMKPFSPIPNGVELVQINRATSVVADATCPSDSFTAAFLVGTVPQGTCSHMGEDAQSLSNRIFGIGDSTAPHDPIPDPTPDDPTRPHRNVFQKLFGAGKDKDKPKPTDPTVPH